MRKNETISVVICTHNRAELASDAVASVLRQDIPHEEYELLIVDNASTDHTREMAQEFCEAYPNVRYVFESKVGLSHARNRGWQEAQGEYIGYLDDDAKVPQEWISVAMDIASRITPEVFGGPYYVFYNTKKPVWFKDEYESHVQGNEPRPLNPNEYLTGSNLFIRRDILAELEGFNSALGMMGKKIAYGEETRFLNVLRGKYPGAILYYEPRLFIYHLASADKMDFWQLPKRSFINGQYAHRTQLPVIKTSAPRMIWKTTLLLLRLLKSCTWDLVRRDKKKYPYFQNFLYETSSMYFSHLGWTLETLSRILKRN